MYSVFVFSVFVRRECVPHGTVVGVNLRVVNKGGAGELFGVFGQPFTVFFGNGDAGVGA